MSNLSSIEKIKLERLFGMQSGYVLRFSNDRFQEFFFDSTGKDIYNVKYENGSGSKAYRLRSFWGIESNMVVGKLINDLLECWRTDKITYENGDITNSETMLFNDCLLIASRLLKDNSIENSDVIQADSTDKDFKVLAEIIKNSIENNRPETALDRLHTYVIKYARELCDKHVISYDKDTPLHSLFGGYVKFLKASNVIESDMTEKILKSSISVLDAFNDVRNNKSLAHDNHVLNYDESVLIFNHILSVIKFINSVEANLVIQSREGDEKL